MNQMQTRAQMIAQNERAWLQAQILSAVDWTQAPPDVDRYFARKYRGAVEAKWLKTGDSDLQRPMRNMGAAPSFGLEAFLANWTGVNDPFDEMPHELCQVSFTRDAKPPEVLSDAELSALIRGRE